MEMTEAEKSRLVRLCIVIASGTVLFLYFMLLCFACELSGSQPPSAHLFVFSILLGIAAGVVGGIDIAAHPPTENQIGVALVVEGVLMIVLTLVAWAGMGRTALPLDQILAML